MKKIVFITPPDARYGFSLGGVSQHVVLPEEAEATLMRVLADPDSGVVVLDERLLAGISEERFREMQQRWYGILVLLPGPEAGRVELEDYALRLIRKALGYHVRLQL